MPCMTGMTTIIEKYPGFIDKLKCCRNEYQLLSFLGHHSVVSNFRHLINASFEGMSFTDDGMRYPFKFDFKTFARSFLNTLAQTDQPGEIAMGYKKAIQCGWINCTFGDDKRVYARQQGHRNYLYPGEDTVRFVMDNIPDMVVVEMVRDPIYQIGSAMRADSRLNLESAIVQWIFAYHRMRNCLQQYPNRYMICRYEDLAKNTTATMTRIVNFMNIEFDPILTEPTFNGQPWLGNSQFTRNKKLSPRKNPQLEKQQVDYIQRSLCIERLELGYSDYAFRSETVPQDCWETHSISIKDGKT